MKGKTELSHTLVSLVFWAMMKNKDSATLFNQVKLLKMNLTRQFDRFIVSMCVVKNLALLKESFGCFVANF